MPIKKAQKYFILHPEYNCTQAILKAFSEYKSFDIDNYASYGRGGSDDGKCGALAGAQLICSPDDHREIEKKFVAKAGSAKCHEIRKLGQLGCRLCVKEAASLALEYLPK
jgi:hypothetical protein